MLIALINNLLALLLMMLAGVGLAHFKLITPKLRQDLNQLLFYFTLPLMVFSSMQSSITWELVRSSWVPLVFGAGLALINAVVAFLVGRIFRIPASEHRLFAFLSMFGNNIYLALPIADALFGPEAVAVVLLYSLGSDLILWSLGQFLLSGKSSFSLADLKPMLNPTLGALLLGAIAGILGWTPPFALNEAIVKIGSITSPIALMLTGAALAGIKVAGQDAAKQAAALFVTKLAISPLLAAGAVLLLGIEGAMGSILVIVAGMPTFVRSIVLTDRYGWSGHKTAFGVMVTTIGCFVTIPLVLQIVIK